MSQNFETQLNDQTILDGMESDFDLNAANFEFYDEELPIADVITLLATIWNVSEKICSLSSDKLDTRTACYWLLRYILRINLESEEIDILLNASSGIIPEIDSSETYNPAYPALKEARDFGRFFNPLIPVEEPAERLPEVDLITVPDDQFLTALKAVIPLVDAGYVQPLNEETVNGLVIMANAASSIDLSKFPEKHTSEMVATLVNACVKLQGNSVHLGLTRCALRIIFEKMGRELSLKGSAMFVWAVNIDNPFYSPSHNTLLAKLVQPWSYWARRCRREVYLNAQELYLLSFILSQTVPKTALVNVAQSRVEVMESIKLYLEEQELLLRMISRKGRIETAGLKCELKFSIVQFLMFNHIIYGWCSGYGAGVNFDWHRFGERQLLWQLFNLDTIKMLIDVSVSYIRVRTWKSEFGVSRLQFARSTLECLFGIFRHTDLLLSKPEKYAFQRKIVWWIEETIKAMAPHARDPSSTITLRELSSFVAVMASTRRALHADGFLSFKNVEDLYQRIEEILEQQLMEGIKTSELTKQEVKDCFERLDRRVKMNKWLVISGNPQLSRSMKTEELYISNLLVEELYVRIVKSLFVAAEFLLQLVNAERPYLAAIWLFVLKDMLDTYSTFLRTDNTWSQLSSTEQEVFKRNILIATTIIDDFLSKRNCGLKPFMVKARLLGIPTDDQDLAWSAGSSTLTWLSPRLDEIIRSEIRAYQPTYGEHDSPDNQIAAAENQFETTQRSREKGPFTNSFESQVYGYVRDYLLKLKETGAVQSFVLRPNIRIFKCEIDLVVEILRSDGSRMILLIECEGESWHSTFGVRNPLDDTKTKVKTSVVLWNLLGVSEVPTIVAIPHREFKSRKGSEQRSYVERLLSQWLS